jgi:hypothetical protein
VCHVAEYAPPHGSSVRWRTEVKNYSVTATSTGPYGAATADEAVERVLAFDRTWAGFELPRLMMALSEIQEHVLGKKYGISGDYGFFPRRVEALFRNPVATVLEEPAKGRPLFVTINFFARMRGATSTR